jgi:hypothetical protein
MYLYSNGWNNIGIWFVNKWTYAMEIIYILYTLSNQKKKCKYYWKKKLLLKIKQKLNQILVLFSSFKIFPKLYKKKLIWQLK